MQHSLVSNTRQYICLSHILINFKLNISLSLNNVYIDDLPHTWYHDVICYLQLQPPRKAVVLFKRSGFVGFYMSLGGGWTLALMKMEMDGGTHNLLDNPSYWYKACPNLIELGVICRLTKTWCCPLHPLALLAHNV